MISHTAELDRSDTSGVMDRSDVSSAALGSVSAILVSFNTSELTTQCVAALWEQLDPARDEVIVVDNASRDSTVADLYNRWPQQGGPGMPRVRIIENPTNAGFGAANNLGMGWQQATTFC